MAMVEVDFDDKEISNNTQIILNASTQAEAHSVEEGYNSQDRTAKRTISAHFVNFEDYIGEVQV
jgi:hypothetical protein